MKINKVLGSLLLLSACTGAATEHPFNIERVANFDRPWAVAFLPGGGLLVTEKRGTLRWLATPQADALAVAGLPAVDYGGQGGLGDVALHPDFAENRTLYLSYAEAGDGNTRGAAVARAILSSDSRQLDNVEVIWRQVPKVSGRGHYGHRLLFSDDGYLFVSSGDRQKFDPSQDMQSNLGKILRLHDDGKVPADNPFADADGVTAQIWSLGHRNPLGIAFDQQGQLWNNEMGPRGGDELNRVERGSNYGYPIVSNGDHYSGQNIPDHDTRPEFASPALWWTPVISPSGMVIYDGELFKDWQGNALISGLSSEALVRVELRGDRAREVARYDMGERIRAVTQGPDGALWLLEDGSGDLLRLVPR